MYIHILCQCAAAITFLDVCTYHKYILSICISPSQDIISHRHPSLIMRLGSPLVLTLSLFLATNNKPSHARESIERHDGNTLVIPTATPECLLYATRSFDFISLDSTDAVHACSHMSSEHHKLLAIELSRCHLHDLGRELTPNGDISCNNLEMETLSSCLTSLTDFAMTTYTQFYGYVNQACIRLMQELMVEHLANTGAGLTKASQVAEKRLENMIAYHQSLMEAMKEREREFVELQDLLYSQVEENNEKVKEYTKLAIQQQQEQQEHWRKEQQKYHEEQANALNRQRSEIEALSHVIASANTSLRPWSLSLETIRESALRFYYLALTLAHGLASLVAISAMTYFRRFRWIRMYLKGLVALEVLLEIGFIMSMNDNTWDAEKEFLSCLRTLTFFVGVCIYIIGLFLSMFRRSQPLDEITSAETNATNENLKMMELIKSLNQHLGHVAEEEQVAAVFQEQRTVHSAHRPFIGNSVVSPEAVHAHENAYTTPRELLVSRHSAPSMDCLNHQYLYRTQLEDLKSPDFTSDHVVPRKTGPADSTSTTTELFGRRPPAPRTDLAVFAPSNNAGVQELSYSTSSGDEQEQERHVVSHKRERPCNSDGKQGGDEEESPLKKIKLK
jgi:hypothetical protein